MDDTNSTYDLRGLEADNLLAFLSLLGLLRALEASRPKWKARVRWKGMPLVVSVSLEGQIDRSEFIRAVAEGVANLAASYAFDASKDIAYSQEEFRALCARHATDKEELQILTALGSDGCPKRDSDNIEPTSYCAIFGQGHQHFLTRLREVVTLDGATLLTTLEKTLFATWEYTDKTPSFRWDPQEDRRYALQSGNPSDERNKTGTVSGANTLAAIGFGVLATVPTAHGLEVLGVTGRRGAKILCWPLPERPTSLTGYKALLQHPALHSDIGLEILCTYGVLGLAKAKRIQVGKFFNFERAVVQLAMIR